MVEITHMPITGQRLRYGLSSGLGRSRDHLLAGVWNIWPEVSDTVDDRGSECPPSS